MENSNKNKTYFLYLACQKKKNGKQSLCHAFGFPSPINFLLSEVCVMK